MLYILHNKNGLNIAWNGRAPKNASRLHWEELFPRMAMFAGRNGRSK